MTAKGPSQTIEIDPSWVPFSSRYGLVKEAWGRDHWVARHADHGIVQFGCCPPEPRLACACPGSGSQGCCEVATAEDLLCNACRDHCWASRTDGTMVRLIDCRMTPANAGSTTTEESP